MDTWENWEPGRLTGDEVGLSTSLDSSQIREGVAGQKHLLGKRAEQLAQL